MPQKLHKRAGFTLAEILLVVGILAIVSAISAVTVSSVRRSTEQSRLDSVAETLYQVANNQLRELYAFRHEEIDELAEAAAAKLPGEGGTTYDGPVRYLTLNAADFKTLLPDGAYSSEWRSGAKIVIEYLPESAQVYAVYFAGGDTTGFFGDGNTADYDDFYGTVEKATWFRSRDNRLSFARTEHKQVGYYSGFEDGVIPTRASLPTPDDDLTVAIGALTTSGRTLDNGEELIAKIAVSLPLRDTPSRKRISGPDLPALTLTLTVTGESSGAQRTFTLRATGWDNGMEKPQFSFGVVLDSLTRGQFKEIFNGNPAAEDYVRLPVANIAEQGIDPSALTVRLTETVSDPNGPSFKPGENLRLRVSAESDASEPGDVVISNTAEAADNSLFGCDTKGANASVRYGRHLQNLDAATSGVKGITGAKQTYDIDFEDGTEGKWKAVNGSLNFVPITNAELTSYDGGSHTIRGLRVTAADTADSAGLFGELRLKSGDPGLLLQNLTLDGISVTGGKKYTGGVLGYASGSGTLTMKHIIVINPQIHGKGSDAGGLVGHSDGAVNITGCEVYSNTVNEECAKDANWIVLD